MVELRGGVPAQDLYAARPSLVPARRGSNTHDDAEQVWKKRQTNRTKKRSTSGNIGLEGKTPRPGAARFDDQDGSFILVTPRSETLPCWPPADTPDLKDSGTWMPGDFTLTVGTDPMSELANVHFPEMGALDGDTGTMTNLDFMNLEWGLEKDWAGGTGTDLDGFPPQSGGGFGTELAFGTGDKFVL